MNKLVLGIVSIFIVLAFAGITFSAENAKGMKMAAGQVKAIDTKTKTLTIVNDKEGDLTYVVTDKTVVRANNKQAGSFDDIKVGDIAALVFYDVNGKKEIKSITVMSLATASPSANKTTTTKPEEKK